MFSPHLGDVFRKATVLAQQSGTSEISTDILLTAFDAAQVCPDCFCLRISTESGGYAFSVDTLVWTPLSPQAAKVLGPFEGIESVDPSTLRNALLSVPFNPDSCLR